MLNLVEQVARIEKTSFERSLLSLFFLSHHHNLYYHSFFLFFLLFLCKVIWKLPKINCIIIFVITSHPHP